MSRKRTPRIRLNDADDDRVGEGKAADTLSKKRNGRVDGPIGTNGNILTRAGRPAGSTNLVPRSIKQAITDALSMHEGGAAGYLYRLSINRPDLFTALVRRLLPIQLRADVETRSLVFDALRTVGDRPAASSLINGTSFDRSPDATDLD